MRTLPRSAVHGGMALVGLGAFVSGLALVRALAPWEGMVAPCLLLLGWVGAVVLGVDALWQGVYRRESTGLVPGHHDPSLSRTAVKFLGLLGSLGLLAFGYWALPVYGDGFYGPYFLMLEKLVPAWLAAAVPYFYLVDRRMREPKDGYWQLGQVLLLRWREVDGAMLGQHLLGWLVKGFFLPLMFVYMCQDMERALAYGAGTVTGFGPLYDSGYGAMYFADVTMVSLGYLATLRIADTHIRSTEPSFLGWGVALACYQPFWGFVSGNYLAYRTGFGWKDWLADSPVAYTVWGGAILALTAVYLWATLAFAGRFSNLTHRGIITNGPYRYSKHPAYLAKNLSWWMIAVPFLSQGGALDALLRCFMLLGVNALYWLRARTEERHLSRDPVYVEYALWMEEHAPLRRVTRLPFLRFLRYRAPAA